KFSRFVLKRWISVDVLAILLAKSRIAIQINLSKWLRIKQLRHSATLTGFEPCFKRVGTGRSKQVTTPAGSLVGTILKMMMENYDLFGCFGTAHRPQIAAVARGFWYVATILDRCKVALYRLLCPCGAWVPSVFGVAYACSDSRSFR